jgi:hypothetical protein
MGLVLELHSLHQMQWNRTETQKNPYYAPLPTQLESIADAIQPNVQCLLSRVHFVDVAPRWCTDDMHAVVASPEKKCTECVDSHVCRSQHVFRCLAVPSKKYANAVAFCWKCSRPPHESDDAEKDENCSGDTIYDTSSPPSVSLGERSGCIFRFLDVVAVA